MSNEGKGCWVTAFRDPEIVKKAEIMLKHCKAHHCKYLTPMGGGYKSKKNTSNLYFCNYLCMTGRRRGCDASECDKWKETKK